MITTKGLHIGYQSPLVAVQDLNLTSGVYVLVGKNGSGKSTFLKTLSGQIRAISGSILINDTDINAIATQDLPKHVAFVSAHFPAADFLRVDDYVAFGRSPFTNYFGKQSTEDKQIVANTIERLNISHLKGRFTSELSDGERQMIAIARALTQEAPIVLLDEPTAFLDYSNKKRVLDNLLSIAKTYNKCVLLSSHDIDLSLESECRFLGISNTSNSISELPKSISKQELIQTIY